MQDYLEILKKINIFLGKNPQNSVFLFMGNVEKEDVWSTMQGSVDDIGFIFTNIMIEKPDLIPVLKQAISFAESNLKETLEKDILEKE